MEINLVSCLGDPPWDQTGEAREPLRDDKRSRETESNEGIV